MRDYTLEHGDIVFMEPEADPSIYEAYGATVLGWGLQDPSLEDVRKLRSMGIHPVGWTWCLTAGAKAIYENPDLRDATERDIEGNPVEPPHTRDQTYEWAKSWYGCTNHPAFRALVRTWVCRGMHSGADGLHVDDHLGTARGVTFVYPGGGGGGFCDYCIEGFRRHLAENETPELLAEAGVKTFEGFDYRDLVRRYAPTRDRYLEVKEQIPLYQEFVDWHLQRAAQNVQELRRLAEDIVGHRVTVSANTFLEFTVDTVTTPYLDYLICEIIQHAEDGVTGLLHTVRRYRMAEAIRRPMACTPAGADWAYVKEHDSVSLVRIWIALAYACGQRMMVPSSRQWCHTQEKGTHWYSAPHKEFIPLYRFIKLHRELFDDLDTVGPLVIPEGVPETFETHAKRQALDAALDKGDPRPLRAGDKVWVFPREGTKGIAVAHLLNLHYDPSTDSVTPQRNLAVTLAQSVFEGKYTKAELYTYDDEPLRLELAKAGGNISVMVPELRQWSIIKFT